MKTLEVPVWLAVVVALGAPLITAAGVVLAQFVNAWRENKREKIRWQRDKVSETARITLEHFSQWREARISSYAEMAECIARFGSIFGELRSVLSPADSITKAVDLEKLTARYATVSERVSLICGEELLECIRRNITTTAVPFSFSYPHDLTRVPDKILEHWKERTVSTWAYYREFRSICRKELGVTTPNLAEPDDS